MMGRGKFWTGGFVCRSWWLAGGRIERKCLPAIFPRPIARIARPIFPKIAILCETLNPLTKRITISDAIQSFDLYRNDLQRDPAGPAGHVDRYSRFTLRRKS